MFVDKQKWGKVRLFSPQQWPGHTKEERASLADRVVDLFHQQTKQFDIQWRPGNAEIRVRGDTSESELDMNNLEKILEAAFQEITSLK